MHTESDIYPDVIVEKIKKGKRMTLYQKHKIKKEINMNKCRYCYATEHLTIDHKVPLAKGGTNEKKNLQCLCKRCNGIKSAYTNGEIRALFKWFIEISVEKEKRRGVKCSKIHI